MLAISRHNLDGSGKKLGIEVLNRWHTLRFFLNYGLKCGQFVENVFVIFGFISLETFQMINIIERFEFAILKRTKRSIGPQFFLFLSIQLHPTSVHIVNVVDGAIASQHSAIQNVTFNRKKERESN